MTSNEKGENTSVDMALNSGAFVLNALGQAEIDAFEAHLAESETTRNEVTELNDTAIILALAVDPVQPSARLKASLMSQLASTPQLPREIPAVQTVVTPAAQNFSAPGDPSDGRPSESTRPVGSDSADVPAALSGKVRARWFNRPVIALTAVAAAFALMVGGGVVANVVGQASFQQQQADGLAAINAADDLQQAVSPVSTGGTATLVWSVALGKSAIIIDGLPELPNGKTYELWYMNEAGDATPAGLFDVGTSEKTWRVLDGGMDNGLIVGVTVEPSGGSDAPTSEPLVAIDAA